MLLATETKTGETLFGSFSLAAIDTWAAGFQDAAFIKKHGAPTIVLSPNAIARLNQQTVRAAIANDAGDTESILGSANDGVHMLLIFTAYLARAILATKGDDTQVLRDMVAPWQPLTEKLCAAHEDGRLHMPYEVKGAEAAAADIIARARSVSAALTADAPTAPIMAATIAATATPAQTP